MPGIPVKQMFFIRIRNVNRAKRITSRLTPIKNSFHFKQNASNGLTSLINSLLPLMRRGMSRTSIAAHLINWPLHLKSSMPLTAKQLNYALTYARSGVIIPI